MINTVEMKIKIKTGVTKPLDQITNVNSPQHNEATKTIDKKLPLDSHHLQNVGNINNSCYNSVVYGY